MLNWFNTFLLVFATLLSANVDASPFTNPLDEKGDVKAEQVVRFTVVEPAPSKSIYLKLETRADFKVYENDLSFVYRDAETFPETLSQRSHPLPTTYFDPHYKKNLQVHLAEAVFKLGKKDGNPYASSGFVDIHFQACSLTRCLLPVKMTVQSVVGSHSFIEAKEFAEPVTAAPLEKSTLSFTDEASLFVEKSLKEKSFLLFPALVLAGLLMNLTPCVYPMIPITLNVMSQFGAGYNLSQEERKRRRKKLPFIYVLGMILSYASMGVIAAMTGTLFGSLLQNVIFTSLVAIVMVVFGMTMLGVFNMSALQRFASSVKLSEKNPKTSVFAMGALSGLVAAPCTGPVLSTILLLIVQTKDPVYGIILMLFFSVGFGLPYIFLGLATERIGRMPKAGPIMNGVKYIFAALMFGLALYFVKPQLSRAPFLSFIFEKPETSLVIIVCIIIFFTAIVASLSLRLRKPAKVVAISMLTVLSTWLTLSVTNSFRIYSSMATSGTEQCTGREICWHKNWEEAKKIALLEKKPLLVDAWALWCAACLTMDEKLWADPEVIEAVNRKFVAVKLDFTDSSELFEDFVKVWELSGLPAVGMFNSDDSFEGKPPVLYRAYIEKPQFFEGSEQVK